MNATTATIQRIPTDRIIPAASNDRQTFDVAALEQLAESIRTIGQIAPAMVRPIGGGRYQLVDGERRYRACKIAGVKLECVIDDSPVGDPEIAKKVALQHAAANGVRVQLNPIEEAGSWLKLRAVGCTDDEILNVATQYKQRSVIEHRISLLALRPDIQLLIGKSQLGPAYGQAMAAAGLDANRQGIALARYQAQPGATLEWFRRVCGELANEQASQSFDGFMSGPIMPAAETVKATLPPLPGRDKAPDVGTTANDKLRNRIAHWTAAAEQWEYLGKSANRDRCLAAVSEAADILALLDSIAGESAPAERKEQPMAELYTIEQAAEYLSLSEAAVKYHVRTGNLVGMTVLGRLVFAQEELDAFKATKRPQGRPRKS